jgi:flavin reductase (DIM6/NTAB) family NADH-FMN oxidoreductase RutF
MLQAFKNAMARRAAGVAVVTIDARACGRAVTITSLVAISLTPALVGFFLGSFGKTGALLGVGKTVGITLLAANQVPLAQKYARQDRGPIVFPEEPQATRWSDAWVFEGASAWLAGSVREILSIGDHLMMVVAIASVRDFHNDALVYHDRRYGLVRTLETPSDATS